MPDLRWPPKPLRVSLGQATTCEKTPEGGLRCSDGSYHAPGCPTPPGAEIVSSPDEGFPVVPVAAAAAAAVAGGLLLLSGPRGRTLGALEPSVSQALRAISASIASERAIDAENFSRYTEFSKHRVELLIREKEADSVLREQERIWESTHRNAEALQTAQNTLVTVSAEKEAVTVEVQDLRARINRSAANVLTYRENAEVILSGLSPDDQAEARRIIDPCYQAVAMRGSLPVRNGMLQVVPLSR